LAVAPLIPSEVLVTKTTLFHNSITTILSCYRKIFWYSSLINDDTIANVLTLKPPLFKYCPFCGKPLQIKTEEGNKEREYCPYDNWTYYPFVAQSVVAIIVKDGKTLMVKRAREPYKNTWMFPAGFVEYGELPEETLVREVREEVGMTVKNFKLISITQSEDDPRQPGHYMFAYKVNVGGEEINNDKDENLET
jgi:ADP-ribose pyrophosphatase YjhB (NUDIX family)